MLISREINEAGIRTTDSGGIHVMRWISNFSPMPYLLEAFVSLRALFTARSIEQQGNRSLQKSICLQEQESETPAEFQRM